MAWSYRDPSRLSAGRGESLRAASPAAAAVINAAGEAAQNIADALSSTTMLDGFEISGIDASW